jgi:hypothetical protein
VSTVTDEERTLLANLASITEMIEQHKTTVLLLERERLELQTRLRLSGYRVPAPEVPK